MASVFVSYSMEDQPGATETLRNWLERRYEPSEVQDPFVGASSHQDVRDAIRKRMAASDSFVVLWTPQAPESPRVLYELGMADALGKPITVLLAGGERSAIPDEIAPAKVIEVEDSRGLLPDNGAFHVRGERTIVTDSSVKVVNEGFKKK